MQPHPKRERPLGRKVFGRDPQNYDRSRFDYPSRVTGVLRARCNLGPSTRVLEIGAGSGKATRQILAEDPLSLLAIEPNARLAAYLRKHLGRRAHRVSVSPVGFLEARVPRGAFDLVVAATSFHWLDEERALQKVARILRPGGWWAAWWNHHGDPARPTEFSRQVHLLLGNDEASWRSWVLQSRRDAVRERQTRLALLRASGAFDRISMNSIRWQVRVPAARIVGLWSTFSEVATLPVERRRRLLTRLGRMVEDRFGGAVDLALLTPMYTARRR